MSKQPQQFKAKLPTAMLALVTHICGSDWSFDGNEISNPERYTTSPLGRGST